MLISESLVGNAVIKVTGDKINLLIVQDENGMIHVAAVDKSDVTAPIGMQTKENTVSIGVISG